MDCPRLYFLCDLGQSASGAAAIDRGGKKRVQNIPGSNYRRKTQVSWKTIEKEGPQAYAAWGLFL